MNKRITFLNQNQQKLKENEAIKIDRFENEIEIFRDFDNRNSFVRNPVLFVGSSSIVYWETSKSFPEFPVINRGFGGASLPEIIHYYNDVIKKYSPSILVVYSDIDVESGKSPDETVNAYKELINMVKADFPEIQILILALKPALLDNFIGKDVYKNKIITNKQLSEYCCDERNLHFVDITVPMFRPDGRLRSDIFLSDGMHLNPSGYAIWNPLIKEKLTNLSGRNPD